MSRGSLAVFGAAVLGLDGLWVDLNLGVAAVSAAIFFGVTFIALVGDLDLVWDVLLTCLVAVKASSTVSFLAFFTFFVFLCGVAAADEL